MVSRTARRWLSWGLLGLGSGCIGKSTPAPPATPEQIDQLCNRPGGSGLLPSGPFAQSAAPAGEQNLGTKEGHSLLAIDPKSPEYRARVPGVCMPAEGVLVSFVQICVDESGTVRKVEILQPSKPILDEQLPGVIRRWKFHPYTRNGTPAPFCYNLKYRVM